MRSYRPEELFDETGRLLPELAGAGPRGRAPDGGQPARQRRHPAARPAAARLPRLRRRRARGPASVMAEDARTLGKFLRDVIKLNQDQRNFRIFGPDETASNRLTAVFEVTDKQWDGRGHRRPTTTSPPTGRVMEMLSEHQCEGWLEGYLLTGRHGLFNCYEAFIHIIDSMFNQHAKWLKVTRAHPLAAADRLAEHPAGLARLAAGPQRLHPPGPRLHRPRGQQEGRDRSASTCRRTPTACSRSWTTACAAGTTSTSSWRASTRRRSG